MPGLVEAVFKSAQDDPDGTAELVRLSLFEALCDEIDANQRSLDRRHRARVAKRSHDARRGLIRTYVDRRAAGQEVDDIAKVAATLATLDVFFAKAEGDDDEHLAVVPDDPATPYNDARDRGGRFASPKRAGDYLRRLTKQPDEEGLAAASRGVGTQLAGNDADAYSRLGVLGRALAQHNATRAAGQYAQVAAAIGPEAERVLSPGLRRTAYRYRGTEKRPNQQLVRDTKEAVAQTSAAEELDRDTGRLHPVAQQRQAALVAGFERGPDGRAKAVTGYYYGSRKHAGLSTDQRRMRVAGDVSVEHLIDQVPSLEDARISWAAGKTPPSVGVMIDRDGDVVSEAMGYNGDHYLPFDLKNLKRLHGGQYVRTRTLGGPTEEDIYTALLTGARQMQVVSNSGVFTVELDPDLRGGRRYSDKARQMVHRYGAIVDAIDQNSHADLGDEGTLFADDSDIPASRKRELRREAYEANDYEKDISEAEYRQRLRRERAKAQAGIGPDEIADEAESQLREWIGHQGRTVTPREAAAQRTKIMNEIADQESPAQARALSLNGEGYKRALDALQREFPYYVRHVDYEPLPDFLRNRKLHTEGSGRLPLRHAPAIGSQKRVLPGAVLEQNQAGPRHMDTRGVRDSVARRGNVVPPTGDTDAAAPRGEASTGDTDAAAPTRERQVAGNVLESPTFHRDLARHLAVITAAGSLPGLARHERELVQTPDGKTTEQFPDRRTALADLDADVPVMYVTWLADKDNPHTEGGKSRGIADFLLTKATDQELEATVQGLEAFKGSLSNYENLDYKPANVDQALDWVKLVKEARNPFGEATEDPATYEPDFDDPKPYPFPDIVNAGYNVELLDKIAHKERAKDPQGWNSATAWLAGQDAHSIGRQFGDDIDVINDDTESEAKRSAVRRQLAIRQKAWSYTRAKAIAERMQKVIGPKDRPAQQSRSVEHPEPEAQVRQIGKRLLVAEPDSPIAKALQRSLASGRISLPRTNGLRHRG